MKPILKFTAFLLLAGILFHLSCKKATSCEGCSAKNNKPPIAVAGPDRALTLTADSVLLDGTASIDPDGTISSFLWTKISGPASFNIIQPTDSLTNVKALVVGTYLFELKVTDNGGLSAKDTMKVIVDLVPTNHPPIANAGADQTITSPTNAVNLDGAASIDPENNITGYTWTKTSGPNSFNILNSNAVQTQVTNLIQGIYQFELKVTDAGGLFSKDTMEVIINTGSQVNCGALSKTLIGNISIPRVAVSILTAGNKILFAGGFAGVEGTPLYGASTRVDIYDMSVQTWSTADLSMVRFHMGTIALGNKIYFAGGDNGNPCSRVDIYDASSNTWSRTELSEAKTSLIAVAAGNKVLFAGGISTTGRSNTVDIYDQSSDSWSVTSLSQPVSGSYPGKYEIDRTGVIAVGNKIYFVTSNHTIDIYDAGANTWSVLVCGPNQLWGATVVSAGDKICFSGMTNSTTSNGFSNTLEIYNTSTGSWSSINMLQPRSDMVAIAADNKIFWAGGFDSSWNVNGEQLIRPVNNIEIYDVSTGLHSFHDLPQSGYWVRALKTNSKIFFSYGNYTEIYDMNNHSWTKCSFFLDRALAIDNSVYQVGADSRVWKLDF